MKSKIKTLSLLSVMLVISDICYSGKDGVTNFSTTTTSVSAIEDSQKLMLSLRSRIFGLARHNEFGEEDISNWLSQRELTELLKTGKITLGQWEELIQLAYTRGSPLLYKPAEQIIDPSEYSINLLWINKDNVVGKGHLLGNDNEALTQKVYNPIYDWLRKQPEAIINFWYDSERFQAPEDAIKNTQLILKQRGLNLDNVSFRSIRDLPVVREHPALFSTESPIYFRVDLAKVLTGDFVIRHEGKTYAINADADVAAVTRAHLFNAHSLMTLNGHGHMMAKINKLFIDFPENSFIILKNNPHVLEWSQKCLIDKAIELEHYIQEGKKGVISSQHIYTFYPEFCYVVVRDIGCADTRIKEYGSFYAIAPQSQFDASGGYTPKQISVLRAKLPEVGE